MTEKDLKSIKFLKLEIKRTDKALCQIATDKSEAEYRELLAQTRDKLLRQKCELEKVINEIDDAEIRLILKLKFVDLWSWNRVALEMSYDRSTVYKKYKKFIGEKQ